MSGLDDDDDDADSAAAEESSGPLVSSVAGALQVGVATGIVQYTSLSAEYDAGGDADFSNTAWGIARNPLMLEAGWGLTDQMVLGGLLQLGGVNWSAKRGSVPGTETSEFNFAIGPKFDFQFMPGSRFNPFASAIVLLGSNSVSTGDETEDSRFVFDLLLRAGVRYFLLDQLSLDPALTFGGVFGSGSTKAGMMEYDYGFSGVQFAINLGLSFWIK